MHFLVKLGPQDFQIGCWHVLLRLLVFVIADFVKQI